MNDKLVKYKSIPDSKGGEAASYGGIHVSHDQQVISLESSVEKKSKRRLKEVLAFSSSQDHLKIQQARSSSQTPRMS